MPVCGKKYALNKQMRGERKGYLLVMYLKMAPFGKNGEREGNGREKWR